MWLSLFYLDDFDKYIKNELGYPYYGRYMDDFYIITKDKDKLLKDRDKIDNFLDNIGMSLHKDKTYIQEVKKGIEFVGSVIKPHRIYLARKSVKLLWKGMKRVEHSLKYTKHINKSVIIHCVQVVNAYLGMMKDKDTWRLRKKVIHSKCLKELWKYCYYEMHMDKVCIRKEGKTKQN